MFSPEGFRVKDALIKYGTIAGISLLMIVLSQNGVFSFLPNMPGKK